ncbi:hypothetical protein GLT92_00275 [Nanohaloarchaea archaeon]|jgi:hypothetical protein|nr:hypothetical protein [Candidatus Nanohaloarchaea archaeon]
MADGGQEEYGSVEQGMKQVFQRHGVEESQADLYVTLAFGNPRFTRDIPDGAEEVMDIYRETMDRISYEDELNSESEPEQVEQDLESILKEGLEGEIAGPASLSEAALE